nr:mitogen-activated protein kinase kinase kinase 15-like [Camelus dromedarius]
MHVNATRGFPVSLSSVYYKETLLNDIQRAREKYQGDELVKELARIKLCLDNTEVLTADIVINLLLSYRNIQDYDAIVKLVETLETLLTCDLADQHNIKFHYAFALNRRNSTGDHEKALQIMLQVLQSCDHPAPSMFCLCRGSTRTSSWIQTANMMPASTAPLRGIAKDLSSSHLFILELTLQFC